RSHRTPGPQAPRRDCTAQVQHTIGQVRPCARGREAARRAARKACPLACRARDQRPRAPRWSLGNESRVRDLYSAMLAAVPEGSVAHAAALAGVAEATAQLAWQGLADREEAERLLREALAVQRALELRQWNSHGIGTIRTATVLSLLVGPNADTPRILDQPDLLQFNLEMLLQGDARDRAEAVRIARERLTPETALYLSMGVARAHVEFHAGSQDEAIAWVRRALEGYSILRRLEEDEHTRMSGDFEWGGTYQTM